MAITRSSFMGDRGGSGGTISAKGMRRISPKDTANLLKSVNAINKNLVAINKALQKQGALGTREQQQEQNRKRLSAEKLQRDKAESAFEAPKKVGEGLKRALEKPAKKIFQGLMSFISPFVKFFAIGFIGWFSKGVVGWFNQEKEKKKKQVKEAIPKILSFMTVAGGVLIALKFGIPVILTLLTGIVSTIPVLIGALLNPATWTGLLAIAAGAAGIDVFGGGLQEFFNPGQRAGKRIDTLIEDPGVRKYIEENTAEFNEALGPSANPTARLRQAGFIEIDGKFYKTADIEKLFISGDDGQVSAKTYRMTQSNRKLNNMVPVSEEMLSLQDVRDKKFLTKLDDNTRANFIAYGEIMTGVKPIIQEYSRTNKALYEVGMRLKDEGTLQKEGGVDRNAALKEQEDLMKKKNQQFGLFQKAYDQLSQLSKDRLESIGVTRQVPLPRLLYSGETEYKARRMATTALDQALAQVNLPSTDSIEAAADKISKKTAELTDKLAEAISEFEINLNVNPIADLTEDDSDESIPTPGGIAPFNLSDPYVQYSKKTYLLLGVI